MTTPQGLTSTATFENILAGRVLRDTGHVPVTRNGEDRVTQLAHLAANEALGDAGWSADHIAGPRTALIVGTSKGTIERWIADATGGAVTPPSAFGLADLGTDLAALLNIRPDIRLTYAAACTSGLHALIQADRFIRHGLCDRALVVAAESSLGEMFQASFARLGVLAPPGYGCRPFDVHRRGFVLSEAAAAICLEATTRPAGIFVSATGQFADAWHLTAIDPAAATLKHLLGRLAQPGPVDFVHAHGTATELNDPAELAAIELILGNSRPYVFSHKAALGHTQGAAGLLSVVINALIHRTGRQPSNASSNRFLPTRQSRLTPADNQNKLGTSIAIAAGFGGPIAGVALSTAL